MLRLRILSILEEKGHTKYWLFKNSGMNSYRNYDNLIHGRTKSIKFDTLEKLCEVLDCSLDDFFEKLPDSSE
ncbi:MAG: helix-turn-helix transcriptional regulator [Lachnospiraceae bacterium]|nr:helix-turn-helix transcriptional regulator [Lachnospiraceae bacterium]